MSTSPGADSTPVERRLRERANAVLFMGGDGSDVDLLRRAAAEVEALRAALLRSQQDASEWEAACGRAQEHADHWTAEAARFASDLAAAEAQRDALATALREWWASKRPVGWTVEQHAANPTVNCVTEAEKRLARALHPHPETPSHE